MCILSNSLRSQSNQTMIFDELMECNVKNIVPEKSYTKCGEESSSKSFSENSNLSISLDQQSEILQFVFAVCPIQELPKYIKIKVRTTCFYII